MMMTSSIFIVSSVCNPIIYSIRNREFRTAVKNLFRRIERCRRSNAINNEVTVMSDLETRANQCEDERFQESMGRDRLHIFQGSRLPPIPEIDKELC